MSGTIKSNTVTGLMAVSLLATLTLFTVSARAKQNALEASYARSTVFLSNDAEGQQAPALFVPKVDGGVVTLEVANPKAPLQFNQGLQLTGEIWNKQLGKSMLPGNLEVSGPCLTATGKGQGEATFEFKITPDMTTLRFFTLGNSDTLNKVALYINDVEWSSKEVEASSKIPSKTEWKLEGAKHAGKIAKVVFRKLATDREDVYLVLLPNSDAVQEVKQAEVKPQRVAPYHVNSEYQRTVKATLTISIQDTSTKDGTVKFYCPVPPDLPSQQLRSLRFTCRQSPAKIAKRVQDTRDKNQYYLQIDVPLNPHTLSTPLEVTMEAVLDIYTTRLAKGPARTNEPMLRCVPTDNINVYLQETLKNNHNDPIFRDWIKNNGLIKDDSELDVDFAYRAYDYLRTNREYAPVPKNVYFPKASEMCYDREPTGCGDAQTFLAAIYNANGIPCMSTGGRMGNPVPGDSLRMHQESFSIPEK